MDIKQDYVIIKQELDIDVSDKSASEDEKPVFEHGLIAADAIYDNPVDNYATASTSQQEPPPKRIRRRPKKYTGDYIAHETFNFGNETYKIPENHQLQTDISLMTNFINEDIATSSETPVKKNKRVWARKYNEQYLKYGFICTTENQEDKPQCVICGVVLANESLKPSKLKRHLETKHAELINMPLDYFQNKKLDLKITTESIPKIPNKNDKALLASYLVAYRVAKERLPHTIAENVLPASMDMVREIFDEESAAKMKSIPLSNTTVSRRISDIAEHLEVMLVTRLQTCDGFAILLDESTDISSSIMILVYVKYVFQDTFMEDLLCCLSLPTNTTQQQIFTALQECIVGKYLLDWKYCRGITSDGSALLTGRHSEVITQIIEGSYNNCIWYHCFLHFEALVSKGMPLDLLEVLKEVVKIVNFIKANSPKSKLCELIYAEIGPIYSHLLVHTDFRWLSRSKILSKVYELRDHMNVFLVSRKSNSTNLFSNPIWLMKLAYVADIFNQLYDLNIKLQDADLFGYWQHIQVFQKSLLLWQAKLKNNRSGFYMFPNLSQHIEENEMSEEILNLMKLSIQIHLTGLYNTFNEYFPPEKIEVVQKHVWVKDPFAFENPESIIDLNFTPDEENEFLQLTCDITLRNRFKSSSLDNFWASAQKDYPLISKSACLLLLPFITTQICEMGFSTLTGLKTKKRNRLTTTPDLRVALSTCAVDWNDIIKNKQAHPSH